MVHSTTDSTVHSMSSSSLEHCICTTSRRQVLTYMYIILLYVAFRTLRQYRDRRKLEAWTMPYSCFEWLQVFFIGHSTIDNTVHSMPLNNLEHCICTTTMTNIRCDRVSTMVPPGYKLQSIDRYGFFSIWIHYERLSWALTLSASFEYLCCGGFQCVGRL